MKNKLLFTLAFLASLSTFAQTPKGFFIMLGGVNTTLKSSDISTQPGMGLKYGLSWSAGYHETYNYQVDFTQANNRLIFPGFDDSGNSTNVKYKNSEFETSIVINYFLIKPEEDKLYLGITGGVFGSYINSSWQPVTSGVNNYDFQNYANINYGPVLGAVLGFNKFKLAVRYNLGMANMLSNVKNGSYNSNNIYTGPTYSGKQSEISLMLYYRIFGK